MAEDECRLRVKCSGCDGTFDSRFVFEEGQSVGGLVESCCHCMTLHRFPNDSFDNLKRKEPPPTAPRKLDYTKLSALYGFSQDRLISSVRTPELADVVVAFANNVTRLFALGELPISVAWLSRRFQMVEDEANKVATVEADPGAHAAEFDRVWGKWFSDHRGPPRIEYIEKYGVKTLNALTGSYLRMGLETVLVAQITGLWTAVESLAGDLWEAAVNAHPQVLADLKGTMPRELKLRQPEPQTAPDAEDDDDEDITDSEDKWLLLSHLREFNYDLSGRMGTALRHRFNFSKLVKIREAYCTAFRKDRNDILAAIRDKSLDDLSSVRNVLIHRAGRVDREFTKHGPSQPPFDKLKAGDRVPIDGTLVDSLTKPALEAALKLIASVDTWIANRRAKAKATE